MKQDELNARVLAEARRWLGTPYLHQASRKHVGCDCLGLLRGIWRHLYGCEPQNLPAYSSDWGEADRSEHLLNAAGMHLTLSDRAGPGSVVMFRWKPGLPAKHLGVVSEKGKFIHAYDGVGVVESTLGIHWERKIAARFEFPLNWERA